MVTGGRPISKGSKHRLIGKLQGATRRRNLRRFRKAAESGDQRAADLLERIKSRKNRRKRLLHCVTGADYHSL